jgi:hypothetical protein
MNYMLKKFLLWVGWVKQPQPDPSLEKLKYLANYRPSPELRKELGMPDISKMMDTLKNRAEADSLQYSVHTFNWNNVSNETMKKILDLASEDIRKNSEKNVIDSVSTPYLTTIK